MSNEDAAGANLLARHGKVSYLEIPADDTEQSATFYEAVFGWEIDRRVNGDRTFFDGSGALLGRWLKDRPAADRPAIMLYIYVTGIREVVTKIAASGGTIVEALRLEGDILVGRFRDPAGNVLGIWEFAGAEG